MIKNDVPESGSSLGRKVVFGWGIAVTLVLTALVFLFVPAQPEYETQTLQNLPAVSDEPAAPVPETAPGAAFEQQFDFSNPEVSYQRFCAQCHGRDGRAQTTFARMMAVKPPDLVKGPFKFERTPQVMTELILSGVGTMPGFEKELGRQNAEILAQYVLEMENTEGE